jgi:regulator of protease activity HflC (stomatin/prohibitin superfamily)
VWPIIEFPRTINWRYLEAQGGTDHSEVTLIETDRIDMREHLIDFGRQPVITKDTVQVDIDALVYFRIVDPRNAVYRVQNLPDAIEFLTQSTLRDIIARMTLDDTFSSREAINADLLSRVQLDSERWGVQITRVEIFNILPPRDIATAMERQIKAERDRRAMVLRADGRREASVIRSRGIAAEILNRAEGKRSGTIATAKGTSEAKRIVARAQATSIRILREALAGSSFKAVDYLSSLSYLTTMGVLSFGGKVVMLPWDAVDALSDIMGPAGPKPRIAT